MARGLRELADRLCLNETADERAMRKHALRHLTLTDSIDETVHVTGLLDKVGATILRKALYPLAVKAGELDERSPSQRNADAFVELGRMALKSGDLPETAGEPTQVVVNTFLADLLRHLEAGDTTASTLDGAPITPNTARMLACDAGIVPAVLGGPSEVLDLGRSSRTWSRAHSARRRSCAPAVDVKRLDARRRSNAAISIINTTGRTAERQVSITPSTCAATTIGSPTTPPGFSPATRTARWRAFSFGL